MYMKYGHYSITQAVKQGFFCIMMGFIVKKQKKNIPLGVVLCAADQNQSLAGGKRTSTNRCQKVPIFDG